MTYLITGIAAAIMQMLAGIYEVFMVDILDRVGINIGANFNEATLGAVLGSMNSGSSFFDQTFAGIKVFQELLQFSALVLIVLFFIIKMTKSLLGPISNGEHPIEIAIRSSIAMAGAMLSYKIFVMFEYIGNLFFLAFKETGETAETLAKNTVDSNNSSGATAGLRNLVAGTQTSVSKDGAQFHLVHDLATGGKMFKKMFMADDTWKNVAAGLGNGATGAITLIMLISIIALIIVTAKFILEIIERYVLLGVMFYTCPLPFVSLVSKNSTVFKSWIHMVLTQIIVMCLNVFFLSMGFIAMDIGWINFVDGAKSISPVDFLLYMFIIISWFLIGTKIDQHIKALGLNTAQAGEGLAGALIGSAVIANKQKIGGKSLKDWSTMGTKAAALATVGAGKGAAESLKNKITGGHPQKPADTPQDDTSGETKDNKKKHTGSRGSKNRGQSGEEKEKQTKQPIPKPRNPGSSKQFEQKEKGGGDSSDPHKTPNPKGPDSPKTPSPKGYGEQPIGSDSSGSPGGSSGDGLPQGFQDQLNDWASVPDPQEQQIERTGNNSGPDPSQINRSPVKKDASKSFYEKGVGIASKNKK